MATITVTYDGELRTTCVHEQSGTQLITDAPTDNNGLGMSFSPTDLVATALPACILTIIGIKARNKGWNIKGSTATSQKIMASRPRRIEKIIVQLHIIDRGLTDRDKKLLERSAWTCPVANTLPEDIYDLNIDYRPADEVS